MKKRGEHDQRIDRIRRQMNERRVIAQRHESEHNRNQSNQPNRERHDLQNEVSINGPNCNVQQHTRSFTYKGFHPPEDEKMKKILEKQTRNAKIIREPFAKPEFYVQCGEFLDNPPVFTPSTYRVTMSMVPDFYVLKLDVDDSGKISQPGQECDEIQSLTGLWFMPTGRVSLRFMFDGFLVQFRGEIENEEIQGRCKKGNELGYCSFHSQYKKRMQHYVPDLYAQNSKLWTLAVRLNSSRLMPMEVCLLSKDSKILQFQISEKCLKPAVKIMSALFAATDLSIAR